ncbi:SPATS2-like protein isoform X2 [Lytechinus variegatus]|nr:SPATS2-like protein isoform X2 [Lytechinus variegatus]XP_041472441.1 SPATS2-like protein isoform X2 [Lytechinus variegatus]
MTDQPRHAQEAFREQIARVHEVVPSRSRDDVALVLQYHEGNVDKAIQSFMEDGARTVLNEWQSHGKKSKSANKRNKKKKRGPDTQHEKANSGDAGASNNQGSASSSNQPSTAHSAPPTRPYIKQRPPTSQQQPQQPRQYQQSNRRDRDRDGDHNRGRPHPRGHPTDWRGGDGTRPGRQQPTNAASNHSSSESGKQRSEKGHHSHQPSPLEDMAERLFPAESSDKTHHIDSELHYQDAAKAKKLVAVLERATKDLHRTSIALTRHKTMLQDKLDQSEKSIPKSFDEIQRFLNERKLALTNEFLEVKQEASELLEAREEQAKELERKTHRAATMTEDQVHELRAEIKQFVSDRKVDEEIGKALRYTWNPDQIVELIKSFGEVIPVQHHYTTRRPSISSLSSINTISRTTSVSEDHGPLSARSISLTESQDSTTMGKPLSPKPANDMDMKAEVAEMAAKLQRSMTQGRKGARNQTGPNADNQNKGERSQQPNRGQGKAQDQQSQQNQGQGGPNPNKQGRNQSRQDRPQHGSRQGQQGQHPQDQRPQGHRPQGQRPQGQGQRQGQHQQQRNEYEEHDGQRKENRNAKRRQNRKQKERKQQEAEEVSNPPAPNATSSSGLESKPEEKHLDERTDASDNVPVSTHTDDPQPAKAPEVADASREIGQVNEENKQGPIDDSNVEREVEKPHHSNEKDSVKVNGEMKEEPKTTNGPLKNGDVNMNGDIKINGDVPHVNGDIIPEGDVNGEVDAPLPQREIKSRRSQKIEDVVKETSALNGVADFEQTEREN